MDQIHQIFLFSDAQHLCLGRFGEFFIQITFNNGQAYLNFVGLKEKLLVVVPLAIFGVIIFGFAVYNTVCKNTSTSIIDC